MLFFCTLFDSNYLNRGLAMYNSLKKCSTDFHLYIFAFDDLAYELLKKINLSNVTVISLSEFENKELLLIKPTRTLAEYCWTCTSSVILYCIEKYSLEHCTYIDADLYFYSNPNVLLDEMKEKSVLITEHRYTPIYDRSKLSGKYCVQFITFRNNEEGLTVLKWWRNACFEWCYNRIEDGKFGDQMYLDDWTSRFEGVHVLQNPGGGLAPWNIQQYRIKDINGQHIILKTKKNHLKFEAVFYHFHYVRFYKNNRVDLGWFALSGQIIKYFYAPYIKELINAFNTVKAIEPGFMENLRPFSFFDEVGWWNKLKTLFKILSGYNLFSKLEIIKKI